VPALDAQRFRRGSDTPLKPGYHQLPVLPLAILSSRCAARVEFPVNGDTLLGHCDSSPGEATTSQAVKYLMQPPVIVARVQGGLNPCSCPPAASGSRSRQSGERQLGAPDGYRDEEDKKPKVVPPWSPPERPHDDDRSWAQTAPKILPRPHPHGNEQRADAISPKVGSIGPEALHHRV